MSKGKSFYELAGFKDGMAGSIRRIPSSSRARVLYDVGYEEGRRRR